MKNLLDEAVELKWGDYTLDKNMDVENASKQDLVTAHFEVHRAWATFKRTGRYKDFSKEDIWNLHKRIADEMKRREMEHDSPMDSEGLEEIEFEQEEIEQLVEKQKSWAEVLPSEKQDKEEIKLSNVLKYFKPFRIAHPMVYLVGGLAIHGKTKGDIDIFIKAKKDDPITTPLQFRIFRSLPKELQNRVQFLSEDSSGKNIAYPFTDYIPLYSLVANPIEPFKKVHMSSEMVGAALQTKIRMGVYFLPLKPTIGYKIGEFFGFEALAENVKDEMYPVVVQKKYDGERVQIHKSGTNIFIYSDDGTRTEHRLPLFVEEMRGDKWPNKMILDAEVEMWKDGEHVTREITAGFLRRKEPVTQGEDRDLVLNVFDILWWENEGALNKRPYADRIRYLKRLPITQSTDDIPQIGTFNLTPTYMARDDDEMVLAAKMVSKKPGSEGAMVKALKSTYPLKGASREWYKYKKTVVYRAAVIEQIETKTEGVYNYRVGILPSAGFNIEKEDLREVKGQKYVYVGKTMNTSHNVELGSTLRVTAENVFLYGNKQRVRLYISVVVEPEPEENPDSCQTVVQIAEDAGLLVHKESTEITEEIHQIELQDYPEDKSYPFVMQVHFRGRSAHHDFRASFDGHLEGWSIFSQPEGVVTKEPKNMDEARSLVNEVDWKWPKETKAQVRAKAKQPKDWLTVEGKFEPGAVGATRETAGYMVIIDKGECYYGSRKTWFYEYFLQGSKYKGRIIFRQIAGGTDPQRASYWVSWVPANQTPYVLSREAIKDKWLPPVGFSALPPEIKSKVPENYKYWKEKNKEKRLEMRDELAKILKQSLQVVKQYDDRTLLVKCEDCGESFVVRAKLSQGQSELNALQAEVIQHAHLTPTGEFYLVHHWWKGRAVVRAGPSVEHYDLFIPPDTQIVLDRNPLKGATSAVVRKPYKKDFWTKGAEEPEEIPPGEKGNPTRSTPAWVQRIDSGKVEILEDANMFKRYVFENQKLKGTYVLERESPRENLWRFSKAERPGEQRIGRLSVSLQKLQKEPDRVIGEGIVFSWGTWNDLFYPEEVVRDRPERLVGKPIVIGSHDKRKTVGKVLEIKDKNGDIWFRFEITDEKGMEVALEGWESKELKGSSVEVVVLIDDQRGIAKKILDYERVAIVPDPACRICKIGEICAA